MSRERAQAPMTLEEIRDAAMAEVLGTPALVAEALLHQCDRLKRPISLKSLMIEGDIDVSVLSVGELLAALMLCDATHLGMVRAEMAGRIIGLAPDELSEAVRSHVDALTERSAFDTANQP